ncbi:MAG: selenite/tellurite reduction operon porin ExtI [Thiohalophilus sp.]
MNITRNDTQWRKGWAAACVALGLAAGGSAQAGPTLDYGEQGFLQLNYAVQFWGQSRGYTSSTDDGDSNDFFLRRNRITLMGQYNDYVGYYAQLEAGNDSKGGNDDRSVYYRDAYLTLDYSDPVRFIAGRFKNTFSRENLEACLEPLTLDRAESLAYTPYGGTRDTGVAMWGNLADGMFQYRVMVSDGREAEETVTDSLRLTGRVHVSLLDPEYDYGYRGTYLGTQQVLTIGASFDQQDDIAYGSFSTREDPRDYSASTVDIFYEQPFDFGTVTLSGAAFDYSVDGFPTDPDPELNANVEREGTYAKAGYLLPNKVGMGRLQFFVRAEETEYGEELGLSDQSWNSLGANYYLDGQSLKVTFEHASIEFDEEHATNPALQDYDQTTVGLQMIF